MSKLSAIILVILLLCCNNCKYEIRDTYYQEKERSQMVGSSKYLVPQRGRFVNHGGILCPNCYRLLPHDVQVDYIKMDKTRGN